MSFVTCDANNLMVFFPSVVCYEGMHFIYGIVAVVGASLFVVFMSFVVLCYFEFRTNSPDLTAKRSGRPYLLYIWMKVFVVLFYSFLFGKEQQYLEILFQFLFAVLVYLKFGLARTYYDKMC